LPLFDYIVLFVEKPDEPAVADTLDSPQGRTRDYRAPYKIGKIVNFIEVGKDGWPRRKR
jgi:hypothetical protein